MSTFKVKCSIVFFFMNVQTWFTSMSIYRLLEGDMFVKFFLASIKFFFF